jgi:hypothetical protein
MNKHILLVMKWLNDKDSVTQEELNDNRTSAAAAYAYAYAYAYADSAYADSAEKWVTKYFEQTCENKQDYTDALNAEKTVRDAVIEFKGDFPSTLVDYDGWTYGWFKNETADSFNFQGSVVCAYDEFNTYVDLLASNMGNSAQSYEEYKIDYGSVQLRNERAKENKVEIDNIKETKSKLFQLIQQLLGYHRINDDQQEYIYEIVERILKSCNIEAKEPSPVFTQEMTDNGVLPSVGMEVMILDEVHKVLLLPDDTRAYVTLYEGEYFFNTIDFMKPLTPPITLIDGKAYQFDYDKYTALGFYKESDCCFYDTACFDEEIAFKVQCTNIQPLTVGKE